MPRKGSAQSLFIEKKTMMIHQISLQKSLFLLLVLFCQANIMSAQTMPETDIWMTESRFLPNGSIFFGSPKNLTERAGYDNQPAFLKNGNLVYTTIREEQQAEIYQFDMQKKFIMKFTLSKESEYSPQSTPDGRYVSTVMVEKDSTQRIWKYDLETGLDKILVAPKTDSVGYFHWLSDSVIAFAKITQPMSLWRLNLKTGKEEKIAERVGRSIHSSKEGLLYFIQSHDSTQWICRFEKNGSITKLIELYKGTEDFVFGKDNFILCGNGSKLYYTDHDFSKGWRYLSDFEKLGVKKITRIAFNPTFTYIAFVDDQSKATVKK
jgi:hypothetical protein